MTTQTNHDVRLVMGSLMRNIQILYQNGEITMQQKNTLCALAKAALQNNNLSELQKQFKVLRYGSLFPEVVEQCIQLTN